MFFLSAGEWLRLRVKSLPTQAILWLTLNSRQFSDVLVAQPLTNQEYATVSAWH